MYHFCSAITFLGFYKGFKLIMKICKQPVSFPHHQIFVVYSIGFRTHVPYRKPHCFVLNVVVFLGRISILWEVARNSPRRLRHHDNPPIRRKGYKVGHGADRYNWRELGPLSMAENTCVPWGERTHKNWIRGPPCRTTWELRLKISKKMVIYKG